MKNILGKADFLIQSANRILDFGCGAGRMIVWLGDSVEQCEVWGVDIQAEHIYWCQQHLSPPFKFATVTTAPHLPFEDRYFDLIYCGSIFSHIDDLADAWLLELKRILRPDGMLYITVFDKHSLQLFKNSDDPRREALRLYDKKMIGQVNFNMFAMGRGHSSDVYYDIDYLQQHWGRFLDVISLTQDAYGVQTAMLLKKQGGH
jgi:ubiquinone/menaquinone biosynthesis C-methylase UbiE